MQENETETGTEQVEKPLRLKMGEAYMMCSECGARLYSFDGYEDTSRHCPYKRNGKCEP